MLKKTVMVFFTFIIISSIWIDCYVYGNENLASVYLTSNKDLVEQGEELDVTVNIGKMKIAACNFHVYFDTSKVEFLSSSKESDIGNSNVVDNRVIFVWFDALGGEGAKDGELITFRFRAKEKGLATFSLEGEFYSEKGQLLKTDFKEKQVEIGNEESNLQQRQIQKGEEQEKLDDPNSNLEVLAIENTLLYPFFEANITNYKVEVSNQTKSLNVFAVPEKEEAMVEITGKDDLQEGNNLLAIIVTALDGVTKKKYEVEVYKRSVEEEKQYLEEQAKKKEELENAYKIEKLSTDIMNIQEETTKKQSTKYQLIGICGVGLVITVLIVLGVVWKRRKTKF